MITTLVVAWTSFTGFCATEPLQMPPYDYEAAKVKLARIGSALQIYRLHHGTLPIASRKSNFDAGLPSSIFLLSKPGKPWSVDPGDCKVEYSRDRGLASAGWHFVDPLMGAILNPRQKREIWAARGEDVPVLYDMNGYEPKVWFGPGQKRLLILRLGGRVDDVTVEGYDVENWILTK